MQVGDPFTEKVLIECCLELYAAKLVVGIQDLGGAGLSCATSELAAAGDGGMHIDLEQVPMRATGMTAAEVLSSESQERMCAVVTPENVDAFMEVCKKWDVLATVIGEVTDGERLTISWHGETVVDVPPRTVAHEGPVYERPVQRPASQDALVAEHHRRTDASRIGRRTEGDPAEDARVARRCAAASGSPSSTTATCAATPSWPRTPTAGVIRVDEKTGRGIALATDASGRYTALDPYAGAQLALAEAFRNVAVTGATPKAVSNCLNFGSPEDPGRHVAVPAGRPRPGGRLREARHPRHRRQRQLLQPDRLDRRSCPPRWWPCSASSTTCTVASPPVSDWNRARR